MLASCRELACTNVRTYGVTNALLACPLRCSLQFLPKCLQRTLLQAFPLQQQKACLAACSDCTSDGMAPKQRKFLPALRFSKRHTRTGTGCLWISAGNKKHASCTLPSSVH